MIKKKKKLPQYIYFKRSLTFLFKSQLTLSKLIKKYSSNQNAYITFNAYL